MMNIRCVDDFWEIYKLNCEDVLGILGMEVEVFSLCREEISSYAGSKEPDIAGYGFIEVIYGI